MNTVPPANPNLPLSNINTLQNNTQTSGVNSNQQASSPEQAAYFASLVAAGQGSSGSSSSGQGGTTGQQSGTGGSTGSTTGSSGATTGGTSSASGSTGNTGGTTNTTASSGSSSNVNASSSNLSNAAVSNLPNVSQPQSTAVPASSSTTKQQTPISISVPQVSDAVAAALMNIQNMQPASVQQAAGSAPTTDVSAVISQIATQVANQILVSAPTANQGSQMVTVVLNQNILPSTQINIQRDNLGTLNVLFNTQNANSAQILNGLQNTIQTSLSANLGQVNVGVNMNAPGTSTISSSSSSGSESGAGSQSSAFQGDAGQGRSRGQYVPQEELPN